MEINSKSLKILAGKNIINKNNISKYSKLQLLNFIKEEASNSQIMALILDGKIIKLDEQAEKIVEDRFYCSKYYNMINEQDVMIPVKHPGVLEVPEGKNVEDLPLSHFQKLAKEKSLAAISKALTNLIVWNKKKNPELANKIDDIQNKLTAWAEKERESGKEIS